MPKRPPLPRRSRTRPRARLPLVDYSTSFLDLLVGVALTEIGHSPAEAADLVAQVQRYRITHVGADLRVGPVPPSIAVSHPNQIPAPESAH